MGIVSDFSDWVQRSAASGGGRVLIMTAGVVVALALAVVLWRVTDRSGATGTVGAQPASSEHRPSRPARESMTRVVAVASGLLAVWAVACSSPGDQTSSTVEIRGEHVPVTQLRGVVQALCETKDVAARDAEAARATFFDRAHDPLHDIAAAAEEVDRSGAARLLEAKQAVEADLEGMVGPELGTDLRELIAATREALRELAVPTPGCDD